jgi:hypothetical protein
MIGQQPSIGCILCQDAIGESANKWHELTIVGDGELQVAKTNALVGSDGKMWHTPSWRQLLVYFALLNLGSSRIELAWGGYKLVNVANGMFITPPRKQWSGPPFISRQG